MNLRRGLALAAASAGIALLLAALAAALLMQPQRLAHLVLHGVGATLDLDIGFEGAARYRLGGTPLLEVHGLLIRRPDDGEPLLRADRALVSLPWSSVRGRSAPLLIERIELDAPVLDLPRLQAWLATRPPGDGALPTLSDGLAVRAGRVLGEGWELQALALDLPRLVADEPLAATARGRLAMASPLAIAFDLRLAATHPADGAGASARGRLRVEHADWQLPAAVAASGPLRFGDGVLRVTPLRFGAAGEFRGRGEPLPIALGLHGPLRLREGTWTLVPATVALRGGDVVPDLHARGRAALGAKLLVELEGRMPRWPREWPTLPPPLQAPDLPSDVALAYAGASDLSDPLRLRLRRGGASGEASGRVAEVLDWLEAAATGSPLPPLDARARVPRLEVAGAVVEGLELSIEGDAP